MSDTFRKRNTAYRFVGTTPQAVSKGTEAGESNQEDTGDHTPESATAACDNVNVKLTKNVNYRFTTFVNLDLCGESIKMSFVLYERPVIFTI